MAKCISAIGHILLIIAMALYLIGSAFWFYVGIFGIAVELIGWMLILCGLYRVNKKSGLLRNQLGQGKNKDLNHPKVKKLTKEIANKIELPTNFINLIFSTQKPDCLKYIVEDTAGSWTCNVPNNVDVAYPLWSCNADETLICFEGSKKWFINGYHDDPETSYISDTLQGALADLFIKVYENLENIEDIEEVAKSCDFFYLDRVIQFVNNNKDDYYKAKKEFIKNIDNIKT